MVITKKDKALIALKTQTHIGDSIILKMIKSMDDISTLFSANPISFQKFVTQLEYNEICSINESLVDSLIENLQKEGIGLITLLSSNYSIPLGEISDPPLILYYKGDISLLKHPSCLAVVGTRRCTNYGVEVAKSLTKTCARSGICIVSGLADGIDSVAHNATLDVSGKTIAVMASGFNHIYPAQNISLVDKIVNNGGLVITEYAPNVSPMNYQFPARNRIVAGICMGVLVVEAPSRSGSIITQQIALELNREIFVVPGRMTDLSFKGSNKIIKSGQGTLIMSADDIVEYYNKPLVEGEKKVPMQLSMEEELIYNVIAVNDEHYETILQKTKLAPSRLNSLLMAMELKNIVKKLPGNIFTSIKI